MFQEPKFWVAVAFVIFVVAFYKPIKKALFNALDTRSATIRDELAQAVRLKEEARELLASYQRKHKEMEKEAIRIVKEADAEAQAIAKKAEDDLEKALNHRIEMTMQKIASYEHAVLQEIRMQATDIAINTVRQVIQKQLGDSNTAKQLLEKSIASVNKKMH